MIAETSFIKVVSVISYDQHAGVEVAHRQGPEDIFNDSISFELKGRDVDRNSQKVTTVLPVRTLIAGS